LYGSRLKELEQARGKYSAIEAAKDHTASLLHQGFDNYKELTHYERKAIHNLRYFTWVEQQGKTVEQLDAQWNPEYWQKLLEDEVVEFDKLINEFNTMVARA
jgi:hypothetical protein